MHWQEVKTNEDLAKQRGLPLTTPRLHSRHSSAATAPDRARVEDDRNGAVVNYSAWILMKALGGDDGGSTQPPPVAPPLLGGLPALLHSPDRHPILCRCRSARQVAVPRRPRPPGPSTLR